MKSFTLFQQKQTVTDAATGIKGKLHNIQIEMNGCVYYCFVPVKGNPDTKLPNPGYWLTHERIKAGETHQVELPFEIVGRICADVVNGVSGTAITMILNVNGCVHVELQPSGETKSHQPIDRWNCSIRDLDAKTQNLIPAGWSFNPEKPSPTAPCRSYMA
jgi:hypothetical protein